MQTRYQVGDYWLSQRKGRDVWYITWFDGTKRQTRFKTTGTSDFQEAKQRLNDHFIQEQTIIDESDGIALDVILLRYWHKHGKDAPSHDVIRYSLAHWSDFFTEKNLEFITPNQIDKFIKSLQTLNLSNGSINRILSDGRAAINRAHKYGEIKSAPFIKSLPKGESFKFRPTAKQFGQFFDAIATERMFRYMVVRLCTACRNDAMMDLCMDQFDFEHNLVSLNPQGRQQTKKHRPTIPMAPTLRYWAEKWDESPIINNSGQSVKSVRQAWRKTRLRAGLPDKFIPKAIRHSVATELRRQGVNQWEVAGLLGHTSGGVTDDYAIYDPAYLSGAIEAIENYLAEIQKHTKVMILPPKQGKIVPIKGGAA